MRPHLNRIPQEQMDILDHQYTNAQNAPTERLRIERMVVYHTSALKYLEHWVPYKARLERQRHEDSTWHLGQRFELESQLHDLEDRTVLAAAYFWWLSKRPLADNEQDHLQNPTVNTVSAEEKALAQAVAARIIQQRRVQG
jgi:hypothetical protein